MDCEPRNAASEHLRGILSILNQLVELGSVGRTQFLDDFAEGFVRDDRRRFVGMPVLTAEEMYDSVIAIWDIGAGRPDFSIPEIIGVRGEHAVLYRSRIEFADGGSSESLVIDVRSPEMKGQRIVIFDVDDAESALAELDRLDSGRQPSAPSD